MNIIKRKVDISGNVMRIFVLADLRMNQQTNPLTGYINIQSPFRTVGVKEQDRFEDDTLVKKRTRKG